MAAQPTCKLAWFVRMEPALQVTGAFNISNGWVKHLGAVCKSGYVLQQVSIAGGACGYVAVLEG